MARPGITFEQVASVADRLAAGGLRPSVRLVREHLGDTGSPNTIQRLLTEWRAARPQTSAVAVEVSPALQAALAAEISRAVMAAVEDAEQRLGVASSEAADLANTGSALEAERDDLLAQVRALQSERDVLQGKATQLTNDMLELSGQLTEAQAAQEMARVEQAKAMLKVDAQAEAVRIQTDEVTRLRGLLDVEQRSRVQAEQAAAVAHAQLEAAERRWNDQAQIGVKAESVVRGLEGEVTDLQTRLRNAELLAVEVEAAKREAAIYRSQAERTTTETDRLRAELDAARLELAALRGAHEALKGRDPQK